MLHFLFRTSLVSPHRYLRTASMWAFVRPSVNWHVHQPLRIGVCKTTKHQRLPVTATARSQTSFPEIQIHQTKINGNNGNKTLTDNKVVSTVAILPLDVIQRIASGEVIHDFTTVVQELVENALDAQSTSIDVDVNVETQCVTVRDDGHGISTIQDFGQIALANSTSKLSNLAQLDAGVCTLGFRGQALWAIAATAESLSVSSRPSSKHHGLLARFESSGHLIPSSVTPVAMSCGTVVVAEKLPWNIPSARRAQAFRRCRQWLFHASLCHPHVTFRLTRSGRSVWTTRGNSTSGPVPIIREDDSGIIAGLLAREHGAAFSDFRHVCTSIEGVGRLVLVIGTPSTVHSASNSSLITAINGRCVQLDAVNRVITSACSLKRGRYPVAFVGVHTNPVNVNWNVCPSKSRMKFRDESLESVIAKRVSRLLENVLRPLPPGISSRQGDDALATTASLSSMLTAMSKKAGREAASGENIGTTMGNVDCKLSPTPMFSATVVAQVLQTYIVVEHAGGIMLIEQHVADERIIYERLCESWKTHSFIPVKNGIQLPSATTEEMVFRLSSLGFDVDVTSEECEDDDGSESYIVRTMPEAMRTVPTKDLKTLILQLGVDDVSIEEAAAGISCRMAVKNGRVLDEKAMKSIVRNLFACSNAHTCPHGRPIFHQIDTKELAGLFGRSWSPERTGSSALSDSFVAEGMNAGKRDFVYGVLD